MFDENSPHARTVFSQWTGLQKAICNKGARPLNGKDLSIAEVIAVSW